MNEDARKSQEDNFAQMAVLALGDYEVPAGWEHYIYQIGKMRYRMTQIEKDLGEYFKVLPWNVTACSDKRLENSPVGLPNELPPVG